MIRALLVLLALSSPALALEVGAAGIGPLYHFTAAPAVLEEAEVMAEMGVPVHKFQLAPAPGQTLLDFFRTDPATAGILSLPFHTLVMWAMPNTGASGAGSIFLPAYATANYNEIYALAVWLRTAYAGTGRRFLLGNWESDNALFGSCQSASQPLPSEVTWATVAAYFSNRQQAVLDARAATPTSDVEVYHYVEVNCVQAAKAGYPKVINSAIPLANPQPDFISYSSYDSLYPNASTLLPPALAYLQKFGQVFIGEFGFKASYWGAQGQATQSQKVLDAARTANLPLALYWAVYDNTGQGYQVIDKNNVQQPVYSVLKAQ